MNNLQLPEPGRAGLALIVAVLAAAALIAWVGGTTALNGTAALVYAIAILAGYRPPGR